MTASAEAPIGYHGDPQIEDGFTRIANELIEALARYPLPGGHLRVLLALVRLTYGFNKKADRVSYGQIAKATGLHRTHVIRALAELVEAHMVIKGPGERCRPVIWSVNKHYLEWQLTSSTQATSSIQADSTRATSSSSTQATRTSSTQATHQRHKDIKDIAQSESTPIPQREMFGALAEVCQLTAGLQRGKLASFSKRLLAEGYTAEQVTKGYGPKGWWYREEWHGKKGQPPTLELIAETIKRAVASPQVHGPQFTQLPDGSFWSPSGSPAARGE